MIPVLPLQAPDNVISWGTEGVFCHHLTGVAFFFVHRHGVNEHPHSGWLGFPPWAEKQKHEHASIVTLVTACKARALKQTVMKAGVVRKGCDNKR